MLWTALLLQQWAHTVCQMAEGARSLFTSQVVFAKTSLHGWRSIPWHTGRSGTLLSPALSPPVSIINRFSAVSQPWCNGRCFKSFASSHFSLFLTPDKLITVCIMELVTQHKRSRKKWKLPGNPEVYGEFYISKDPQVTYTLMKYSNFIYCVLLENVPVAKIEMYFL